MSRAKLAPTRRESGLETSPNNRNMSLKLTPMARNLNRTYTLPAKIEKDETIQFHSLSVLVSALF